IHRLISQGTIEEKIYKVIGTKSELAQRILDTAQHGVDVLTEDDALTGLLSEHLDAWDDTEATDTPLPAPQPPTAQDEDEEPEASRSTTMDWEPTAGPATPSTSRPATPSTSRETAQPTTRRGRHEKRASVSSIDAIINPKRVRIENEPLKAKGTARDAGTLHPSDPQAYFRSLLQNNNATPPTRPQPRRSTRGLRKSARLNTPGPEQGSQTTASSRAGDARRAEQLLYGNGAGAVSLPLPLPEAARQLWAGSGDNAPDQLHELLFEHSQRYREDYLAARDIYTGPDASQVGRGKRNAFSLSDLIEEHAQSRGLRAETGRWWYEHLRREEETVP
ncbi:hypothetical protein AB0C77_14605, partial [Streptomyces sp. NPDC048629]|uniref:hypothetical protein n=1 Tax=Streptomyces sp. NPDC048629 TaxID=3154824 RepID=UPI00341CABBA